MNWAIRSLVVLLFLSTSIFPAQSQDSIDPNKLLSRITCNGTTPKWPPDFQKQAKEFIYKSDEMIAKLSWDEYLDSYNKFVELVRLYSNNCMYQARSQQIDACVKNIEALTFDEECASLLLTPLTKCSYMPYTTRRATAEVSTITQNLPQPPPFIVPNPGAPPHVPSPGELLPFFLPPPMVFFAPPDDAALQNYQSAGKTQFEACLAKDKSSSYAERLEQIKVTIAERKVHADAALKATASLMCLKIAGLCN